jgi:hypothetical protein
LEQGNFLLLIQIRFDNFDLGFQFLKSGLGLPGMFFGYLALSDIGPPTKKDRKKCSDRCYYQRNSRCVPIEHDGRIVKIRAQFGSQKKDR